MHAYWIDPLAPLVFRSGKPFGTGSRDGANFPWPSAFAGLMRTNAAETGQGQPEYDVDALRRLSAAGPFLAKRTGDLIEVYIPKPRDAIYLQRNEDRHIAVFRMFPGAFPKDCGATLPDGLHPIVLEENAPKGKPYPGPAFWPLSKATAWRLGRGVAWKDLEEIYLPIAVRTHVAIDSDTLAAEPGKLFQTEGWSLGQQRQGASFHYSTHRWGFVGLFEQPIEGRAVCFGGERRLSWMEAVETRALTFPEADRQAIEKEVRKTQRLALTFVTPAAFADGWRPAWADGSRDVPGIAGLRLRLVAAAVDRWIGHSGWDLALKRPKPARALVPAGSTYWFDVVELPADAIARLWLASVCDDGQDRKDGFGLVIPGV